MTYAQKQNLRRKICHRTSQNRDPPLPPPAWQGPEKPAVLSFPCHRQALSREETGRQSLPWWPCGHRIRGLVKSIMTSAANYQCIVQNNKNSSQSRKKGPKKSSEKPQSHTSLATDPLNQSRPWNSPLFCCSRIGPASRNRRDCHLPGPFECYLLYLFLYEKRACVFFHIEYLAMYFCLGVHIFISEIYLQKHKLGSVMEQKILTA